MEEDEPSTLPEPAAAVPRARTTGRAPCEVRRVGETAWHRFETRKGAAAYLGVGIKQLRRRFASPQSTSHCAFEVREAPIEVDTATTGVAQSEKEAAQADDSAAVGAPSLHDAVLSANSPAKTLST